MVSGNTQQPLKTKMPHRVHIRFMSYSVHIRVLDSHQELLIQQRSVMSCPTVGVFQLGAQSAH
jgi:hypothetical protein